MSDSDPLLSDLCSIWYARKVTYYNTCNLTCVPTAMSILLNTAVPAAQRAPALYPAHVATNFGRNAQACVIQLHI
jgi:hypothetical protein